MKIYNFRSSGYHGVQEYWKLWDSQSQEVKISVNSEDKKLMFRMKEYEEVSKLPKSGGQEVQDARKFVPGLVRRKRNSL